MHLIQSPSSSGELRGFFRLLLPHKNSFSGGAEEERELMVQPSYYVRTSRRVKKECPGPFLPSSIFGLQSSPPFGRSQPDFRSKGERGRGRRIRSVAKDERDKSRRKTPLGRGGGLCLPLLHRRVETFFVLAHVAFSSSLMVTKIPGLKCACTVIFFRAAFNTKMQACGEFSSSGEKMKKYDDGDRRVERP